MKKQNYPTIGVTTALLISSMALSFHASMAVAADWTIMQTATITTAQPDLKQGDVAPVMQSTQAVNGIALEQGADDLVSGSQQTSIDAATSFTMTQGGAVDQATQALNDIEAQSIGSTGNIVTQTVIGATTAAALIQETDDTGAGNSNLQAFNSADASQNVNALTQTETESGTLTLTQVEVPTNNNIQAVNFASAGMSLGTNDTEKLDQSASITGTSILDQRGEGAGNVQGINIALGTATTSTVDDVEQTYTARGGLDAEQTLATGSGGNTQALNYADTLKNNGSDISALTQELVLDTEITFTSNNTVDDNIQAGNLARSGNNLNGGSLQSFLANSVAGGDVNFDMLGGGTNNIQAGNMVEVEGLVDDTTQTFDVSNVLVGDVHFNMQVTGNNNIQAGNLADVTGNINGLIQNFDAMSSGNTVTFEMDAGGTGNIQAGNLVQAASSIQSLRQDLNASDTDNLILRMEPTANMNTQAGNIAVITGSSDISGISQIIIASSTANEFIQTSTSGNLIQAGNFIDIAMGAISDMTGPHQDYKAGGTLSMTQNSGAGTTAGGTDNLQVINGVVDITGGTASVNLVQEFSATGGSFMMAQNGVASSGQFGNFAGLKY